MLNKSGYIYVRNHDDWKKEQVCKWGITDSLIDREAGYKTGEYLPGEFTTVIEVPKKNLKILDTHLKDHFKIYHKYKGAGTEFYDLSIENKLFSYLKTLNVQCKQLTNKEIKNLKRKERIRNLINALKKTRLPQMIKNRVIRKMAHIRNRWFEREYQRMIIDYGVDKLTNPEIARLYLELATGGGKSYCIYSILKQIMPNVIVIMSPRKKINTQNCCKKYLFLLNNEYNVFNMSESKQTFEDFKKVCEKQNKKIMIVGCPQKGHEKVYDFITEFNLNDVFIWFDEAHNTVENWVKPENHKRQNQFLLNDTERIKYRIFTSASPYKKIIEENKNTFGELYSPIKVKDLIALKWLSPIIPYIFSLNQNNVDICNYNLNNFTDFKCKYGFSFHNMRDSAFNLFLQHYNMYNECKTKVKPFLLVGNDYNNPSLDKIRLDYNYRSIYEYEKTENSMGYVVDLFKMGYDFNGIDYIIFSDPMFSYQSIIQAIGRGTRPDGKGENGKNLYKILRVMLPVYIESEINTDFDRIKNVLRYLVHDIDYSFKKIDMHFSFGNKKVLGEKYSGEENMRAILLDLLKDSKYSVWKQKDFICLMKSNNIHDRENAYNNFCKDRPELNLPDNPYKCFPDFTWEQTYDESPYYSKQKCKEKIAEIKENNEELDLEEEAEPEIYLNSIDSKIPPCCLFTFYGGVNNNEYY